MENKIKTVNAFKKQGANGKKLAEEVGEGLNYSHPLVKKAEIENNATITVRLPQKEKDKLEENFKNPSDVVRALIRGINSQNKQPLKEEETK
jgi:site-specific recombinase XerC